MYSKELLKGTLKTIVLQLLTENDKMYGYEIAKLVKHRSQERILLTEGALYPTLHRLEAEGLVETESIEIGKRMRKYYKLTEPGKEAATQKVSEFDRFVQTMHILLHPQTTS